MVAKTKNALRDAAQPPRIKAIKKTKFNSSRKHRDIRYVYAFDLPKWFHDLVEQAENIIQRL